jgi:hypothetical protein
MMVFFFWPSTDPPKGTSASTASKGHVIPPKFEDFACSKPNDCGSNWARNRLQGCSTYSVISCGTWFSFWGSPPPSSKGTPSLSPLWCMGTLGTSRVGSQTIVDPIVTRIVRGILTLTLRGHVLVGIAFGTLLEED